ncbi:MAG: chromosomal replication initiator DnaA [Sphingomonadaceae bacterium]|nr:chromosomal replication initiator DnaA [Sphingomonadaceae bacterium]
MAQLPLPLAYAADEGAASFVHAAANADAVAWLAQPPAARTLLVGPPTSGKTHLGRLFAERHRAMLVDDAEAVDQERLFHIWNAAAAAAPVLFTAREVPRRWVTLPDLASRLAATPTLVIGPPDEALLSALIIKHFADRGVRLAPEVAAYTALRIERSFAAAARVVAVLDAVALARMRQVTVPLVREVLEGQGDLLGDPAEPRLSP